MALELNGTTGVSLVQDGVVTAADLASGAITSSALPAGSVLQVVNNNMTGRTIISSTSFVSTQVTASITPSSASSKILVLMNTSYSTEAANRSILFTVFRGSTNLGDSSNGMGQCLNSGALQRAGLHLSYLDSPNTTSSVTYTLYGRSTQGNNVEIPFSTAVVQNVTLMEIAG